MKQLTVVDIRQMKHGDSLWRINKYGNFNHCHFCGMLPTNDNYVVVFNGTNCETIHCPVYKSEQFFSWYGGEYDAEFAANLLIEFHKKRIESIKAVYFPDKKITP